MRPMTIIALMGALGVLGCGMSITDRNSPDDEATDPIPVQPPSTLTCDHCVNTAPATYTGPSNFFRGSSEAVPDCQEPTPLQGIEGFVTEPTLTIDFVRECRITPSDTCKTEGKVCAPVPEEGFSTCIHHVGVVACQDPYTFRDEVVVLDGERPFTFTLCCMPAPGPA